MSLSNKKGFTLVEIIIVVVVLTIAIVSALTFINNGINFTKISRQKVLAINFVRQNIESVYQIRDTNRQKWGGKKNQCRLKIDPLNDENDEGCEDDQWMENQIYIVLSSGNLGNKYFLMSGVSDQGFDILDGFSGNNSAYRLCYLSGQRKNCPFVDRSIGQSPEGNFLSQVEGKGVFLKNIDSDGGEFLACENGESDNCGNDEAKEFRFCSKVGYFGGVRGEIEICSLITNFMD